MGPVACGAGEGMGASGTDEGMGADGASSLGIGDAVAAVIVLRV